MFLSRLRLDPGNRKLRRDLADCHALHQRVMSAFPTAPPGTEARAGFGVLYRLDSDPRTGRLELLVQSQVPPDWSGFDRVGYLLSDDDGIPQTKSVGHLYAALQPGMVLRFRLRANPTRRLSTPPGPDGRRPPGKRVDLRDEAAQLAWLRRKGEQSGFALLTARAAPEVPNVQASPQGTIIGSQPGARSESMAEPKRRLTFGAARFEGALRITDAEAFRRTLEQGVGSGKAYGFGLLSVAPGGTTP